MKQTGFVLLYVFLFLSCRKNDPRSGIEDTVRSSGTEPQVIATVISPSGGGQCLGNSNTMLLRFENVYFDAYRESSYMQGVWPNQSYRLYHMPDNYAQANNLEKVHRKIGTRIRCTYNQLSPYGADFIWCTGQTLSTQILISDVELIED